MSFLLAWLFSKTYMRGPRAKAFGPTSNKESVTKMVSQYLVIFYDSSGHPKQIVKPFDTMSELEAWIREESFPEFLHVYELADGNNHYVS